MKKNLFTRNTATLAVCALGMPLAVTAQTTVFTDNFSSSTINGTSTPGGTPTASSTSYDFDSEKTGVESISSGNLNISLSSATTGGAVEAEALFTTTPVTLVTPGDYINLTYTFTDTGNILAAIDGTSSSALYTGLYYSGGSAPIAGTAGVSGNAVSLGGAASPTGGAQNWQGYYGRITGSGGTSQILTRAAQTGGSASGTSSAQDLVGNNAFTGAFGKSSPGIAATQVGSTVTSPGLLTTGDQYTLSYQLTLASATSMTVTETLTGNGVSFSQTETASGSSFLSGVTSFDGLAIGDLNNGVSANPQIDINSIVVTDSIQAVPEPSTFALAGLGSLGFILNYRRRMRS